MSARTLQADYANEVRSYLQTRRWADLVARAFEVEEVPDALFHEWEHTEQYRQLRQRFEVLYDMAAEFLKTVAGGSGRPLGRRLTRVAEAARLSTKIDHLATTLNVLQTETLHYRTERTPRVKKEGTRTTRSRGAARDTKAAAWGILSAVLGIFAISAFFGVLLLGVLDGLVVSALATCAAFVVLKLTEGAWAPWLTSTLTRARR